MWDPSTCDGPCNEACKIDEYLKTVFTYKNCSYEKPHVTSFGKATLAYQDEILNTTETLLVYKKVICVKNVCLIYTILLVVICILLVVISISFYYDYTKHWTKKKCSLSY